jgi:hypothetical protein
VMLRVAVRVWKHTSPPFALCRMKNCGGMGHRQGRTGRSGMNVRQA